jgi:MFS family permease
MWLPALGNRLFFRFWLGRLVSSVGTHAQAMAQGYLVYRINHRTFDLGLVGAAFVLPTLLFAVPAGAFVERRSARNVLVVSQILLAVQAVVLGVLCLTGSVTLWRIVWLAFIEGTLAIVSTVAVQTVVPQVVGQAALGNAIALNAAAFDAARFLGPAIAGAFLARLPEAEGWAFIGNGVSFGFILASLLGLPTTSTWAMPAAPFSEQRKTLEDLLRHPLIRSRLLISAVFGFFAVSWTQMIPALARDLVCAPGDAEGVVARTTGALFGAAALGALLGSGLMALLAHRVRIAPLLLTAMALLSGSLFAVGIVASPGWFLPLVFVSGLGGSAQMVAVTISVHSTVSNAVRARATGLLLLALTAGAAAGNLIIGSLAATSNLRIASVVAAVAIAASAALAKPGGDGHPPSAPA